MAIIKFQRTVDIKFAPKKKCMSLVPCKNSKDNSMENISSTIQTVKCVIKFYRLIL